MSLTKVSYSMIGGAVINVIDYGAVGDGSTDNGTAIQAAVDACPYGGTVYFPKGYYRTTTQITLKNQISLLGDGVGSQLFMDGNHNLIYAANQRGIRIEKIGFFSNNTNSSNACIYLYRVDASYLDVQALGGKNGLYMQGCLINEVRIQVSTNNSTLIYNGWTLSPTQNGVYLTTAFNDPIAGTVTTNANTFINPVIEGVVYGVFIYGQDPNNVNIGGLGQCDNQFIGGSIEGNSGVGLYADGTYQPMLIDGTHFEANAQDLYIVRCGNVRIENVYAGSSSNAYQSNYFVDSVNMQISNSYFTSLYVASGCVNFRSYNCIIRRTSDASPSSLFYNYQYTNYNLPYGASDSYVYGQVEGQLQTVQNTNSNLQTWTVSTIPDGYQSVGSATIAKATSTVYTGTYSAQVTAAYNTSFAYSGLAWPISTAYYGYWITVEVWVYSAVASNAQIGVGTTGDWKIGSNAYQPANTWVRHVVSFQAASDANEVVVFAGANTTGANTPVYVGKFVIYSQYPN